MSVAGPALAAVRLCFRGWKMRFLCWMILCGLAITGCSLRPATHWYLKVDPTLQRPPDADSSWDFAHGRFPDRMTRETAFEILLKTDTFASTHVNANGGVSTQARAFQRVLDDPEASSAFGDLVRRGRTAGQLYGLLGLYLTDRAEFDREVVRYRSSTEPVSTKMGCSIHTEQATFIVGNIESGLFPKMFGSGRL
jgi:hypothetical protein